MSQNQHDLSRVPEGRIPPHTAVTGLKYPEVHVDARCDMQTPCWR